MKSFQKGMITMTKNTGPKLIALLIAALLSLSCLTVAAGAVTDQDMAQISVTVSNKNPTKNETITVTAAIDNYRTMSPRISAMQLSVSFDTSCFDYVPGSATSLLKINNDDLTSVAFDGIDKVSFAYTYANTRKLTLPTTAKEIFSFKLRVKSTVTEKTVTDFIVSDLTLYNGKKEAEYSLIECKEPKTDTVTAWGARPGILLNGSDKNNGKYSEDVWVTFDAATGSLVYEGRPAVSITSPYHCDKNGTYTITVTSNGERITESFRIEKSISHISVKPGTYNSEYPVGITPDYSAWVLLVTYSDGTYSELAMDDRDIDITGFEPGSIGEQRLLIKYKEKTTYVIITVSSKNVRSFSIGSPIAKTEYLIGDEIDTTGGVLLVDYDDNTSEQVPITKNMLSGYDNTFPGEQNVTVTYSTVSQSFKVTFYRRDTVDELITEIDALDLNTITADSRDQLAAMITKYNSLLDIQKKAVVNFAKLQEASLRFDEIIKGGTDTDSAPATDTEGETTGESETKQKTPGNIIWYIVAGIIILSVLGGVGYFLFIYFKRKKEIDDDDEYYDDGDFDDDENDDGDLSYEEDIINIEDEDNDFDADEEGKDDE